MNEKFIGIEPNPEYIKLANANVGKYKLEQLITAWETLYKRAKSIMEMTIKEANKLWLEEFQAQRYQDLPIDVVLNQIDDKEVCMNYVSADEYHRSEFYFITFPTEWLTIEDINELRITIIKYYQQKLKNEIVRRKDLKIHKKKKQYDADVERLRELKEKYPGVVLGNLPGSEHEF